MIEKDLIAKVPVEVYAELTPNPNSMKFVSSIMLLPSGVAEYESKQDAVDSPLAQSLFDFTGVKKVFITANFVTVTKTDESDWYDITPILREYIKGYLGSGEKAFTATPQVAPFSPTTDLPDTATKDPATEEKIRQLLDEYVRPAVEGDGGAIELQSYNEGVVNVILKGACSGCPSSTLTLKSGIETLLKKLVPEVKEVVAVNG